MLNSVFMLKTRTALLLLLVISMHCLPLSADEKPPTLYGSAPGEKLIFNVHWMGIPAGIATMSRYTADIGKYKVEAILETTGMVSFIHALKDTLLSTGNVLESGKLQTVKYHKNQRKGKRVRITDYKYDRENLTVIKIRKGEKARTIKTSTKNANDPISVFYTMRSMPTIPEDSTLSWLAVDGSKEFTISVKVGKKTKRYTPLGWFDLFPVTVMLPADGGLINQTDAITILFTADNRRLPIRVETKLSLGGVAADLIEYYDGRGGHGEINEGNN
ncbi:MAG: DUF3108 domain-containing protein [Magnetococcales bacterium]|nr:DUF3108 domain-containing protein [Magnetococcales bacterium]